MASLYRGAIVGVMGGAALALAIAPAQAQLEVTGGNATLENTEVFVPQTGELQTNTTGTVIDTDNRAFITEGNLQEGSLLIQTTQGDIPTNALFRFSTLPVIQAAGNGGNPTLGEAYSDLNNFAGSTGRALGTLSFRSITPGGPQFINIPTTLNFQIETLGTEVMNAGAATEFRTNPLILQEVGFVVDGPSAGGAVRRQTPVVLVQYQDGEAPPNGSATPSDQIVLNNFIFAEAYSQNRAGETLTAETLDLSFTGGRVDTPPGFNLEGPSTEIDNGILISRIQDNSSRVDAISFFTDPIIVEIPYPPDDDDDDNGGDDGSNNGGDDDSDDDNGDDDSGDDGSNNGGDDSDDDNGDDGSNNGGDDSDDDSDDGDDDSDDGRGNPHDGEAQVRPIFPRFIFVGLFVFRNVPSGRWFDPPMADGFQYEMTPRDVPVGLASRVFPGLSGIGQDDDALFTAISGFPTGIDDDDRFVVSVDGQVLGTFGPDDTVNFRDYAEQLGDRLVNGEGVARFTITDIDPAVDSADPMAFPLKLDFNTRTASFEMRALEAEATRPSSGDMASNPDE